MVSPSTAQTPFQASRRLLAREATTTWVAALVGFLAFAGAWLFWGLRAEVHDVATSDRARVEAVDAPHPVDALASGRLTAIHARLGQRVAAGQPLFDLDADTQRFELAEAEALLTSLQARLEAVRRELTLVERLRSQSAVASKERLRAAELQHELELIIGRFAETEYEQARRLNELGLLSDLERSRYRGELEKSRARASSESAALVALTFEVDGEGTDLEARSAHLDHERIALEGQIASSTTHLEHLRHEADERSIVAPGVGRIGWLADLQVGAAVSQGQHLAEVVPEGDYHAVTWFPESSAGRIQPGQKARLRLDAFPWTEFGVVRARVHRVASEPSERGLRVDLALEGTTRSNLVLSHGLTGRAEVVVETLSPARWLLRAAGGSTDEGNHRVGDRNG